ncbi:cytoplasmic protein [Cryptococcus wingfieldii CBS 7118]|uniref:Cytoplasmic protein n=1 Tax=Cryptococcus wingfieldii CBS 7118 TaxID=1295528 RepID=A0A1E3IQE7_9TREE|nr:cytoplasmic protein [Cryptococcus wingfieldii CBS 7118]ODN90758.1 cytoplasmic protein [Cryptococcus wingfieldii CBS 7118]
MSCFFPGPRGQIQLPADEEINEKQPVAADDHDDLLAPPPPVCASFVDMDKLFTALESEDELKKRLKVVREKVGDAKVDWYVVPSEDEHQSEEVGDSEKRRQCISGFTGSAGTAIIPSSFDHEALLFVDSRYWIQAEQQVVEGWKVVRVGSKGGSGRGDVVGGWVEWAVNEAEEGSRIGIDPKLISLSLAQTIQSRLTSIDSKTTLVPISQNLIDKVWNPPARSTGPINAYPLSLSGEDTPRKLARSRAALAKAISGNNSTSQDWVYILPTLPAIAWLLNYRCPDDIPFCPVAYAYLALTPDKCVIFVDRKKITEELGNRWEDEGIEVRPYGVEQVGTFLKELASAQEEKSKLHILAPPECSWALSHLTPSSAPIRTLSPCPIDTIKAIKNSVEQQNFRNAYLRDGHAMVRWFAWLEKALMKDGKKVGEWAAAMALGRERRREENFAGLAYDDISASGPNAASPHYVPHRGTDRLIDPETTYLIDSGAQYLDATIDTTRTHFFGSNPSPEIKRAYTRVLQGHIAVSRAKFPRGMPADRLAMSAREKLYEEGLDFGHGVGHGVGSYLAVHENPMFPKNSAFEPGHVTTIEPGYYKEGEFGIRIESVLLCKPVEVEEGQPPSDFLTFERITQVPIQTTLVDWALMAKYEAKWINDHNRSVQDALEPLLQADEDKDALEWLKKECKGHKIWPWDGI